MLSKIIFQLKREVKHNSLALMLANLFIIGISYLIFGFRNLDANIQAMIIERFLPLAGIFSLVTLFYAEHQSPIKDILVMCNTRIELIYVIRLFFRFLLYGVLSFIYIYLLMSGEPIHGVMRALFHSVSIGVLIGGIGLLVFTCTNNISVAFLSSVGLIFAQWFAPKDKVKNLLLFTMPKISVSRILLIFGVCLVIFIVSIAVWKRKLIS